MAQARQRARVRTPGAVGGARGAAHGGERTVRGPNAGDGPIEVDPRSLRNAQRREKDTYLRASRQPRTARRRPIAALVLSIAGFGIALYETISHYAGIALSCPANSFENCQAVTTSSQSMVFGVFPVALLGLIFFTVMVPLNLPVMWRSSLRWVAWLRLAAVVGGMGFVIYLLYTELFSIKKICLWCTGVHVVTFLLFVLVISSLSSFSAFSERTD